MGHFDWEPRKFASENFFEGLILRRFKLSIRTEYEREPSAERAGSVNPRSIAGESRSSFARHGTKDPKHCYTVIFRARRLPKRKPRIFFKKNGVAEKSFTRWAPSCCLCHTTSTQITRDPPLPQIILGLRTPRVFSEFVGEVRVNGEAVYTGYCGPRRNRRWRWLILSQFRVRASLVCNHRLSSQAFAARVDSRGRPRQVCLPAKTGKL